MARAKANGIELEYETFGQADNPTILLIMGFGAQLVLWRDSLCHGLAEAGYHVIRYDNRDVGLSSKIEEGGVPDIGEAMMALAEGRAFDAPYLLSDMALDGVGLLDALGIETAHIVGASMGGMIAQLIAANHSDRVRSLTSIMSTSGDPRLPEGKPEAMAVLVTPVEDPTDREAVIANSMNIWRTIGSPGYPASDEELRDIASRAVDRCVYLPGISRQLAAIIASGPRTEILPTITAPTLVIHGADDPLIPVEAGKHTAELIPEASLRIIDGMGHDFPEALVPVHIESILSHVSNVENRA